jgi:bacterioferritin-associated ferredoxin
MYVCLCHNVTDTEIRRAVRIGEIRTMVDLREQMGVSTQCGKCAKCAKQVLREALREVAEEATSNGLCPATA